MVPGRQTGAQPASLSLSALSLRDFRNYADCRVTIDAPNILLLGENGAGKTNLMEAVSLLAPGRGLRRARAEHLPRQDSGSDQWAVSADLQTAGETIRVGTGVPADSDSGRRIMRCDGETVPQTEIGRLLSVSWLTPRMDGIFVDSPSARRRFLDRLVIAFDAAHIGRTNRYDKLLRTACRGPGGRDLGQRHRGKPCRIGDCCYRGAAGADCRSERRGGDGLA